jgi:hypothetical protein
VFPDDYRTPFQKRRLLGIPEEVFRFYQSACAARFCTSAHACRG